MKDFKEWNRIYWMEKNRMMPSDWPVRDMKDAYDRYFPRVWCRFETEDLTEEFELAWNEYQEELNTKDKKTVLKYRLYRLDERKPITPKPVEDTSDWWYEAGCYQINKDFGV
jgi:hypothetical protein